MILESYYIHRIGGTTESWCVIRFRKIVHGFERVGLGISAGTFQEIAEEARKRPETLKESLSAIYPDQPRPVPEDIVEVKVEMDKATKNGMLFVLLIRRGHYMNGEDVLSSSISKYKIEEVKEE